MSENKIKFPVKLASNNPKSFGIVDAMEISGHRSVDTLSGLYSISDPVLSILKDGSDAIGQEWFVVSEDCKYRLDNWANRKTVAGWTKLPKQELINTKQSVSEKDQPSGYAGLDSNGKVPIEKTYGTTATVVDVETYESLPVTGLSGVIYYVSNTSAQYKWSGSSYIDITDGADNAKKNETSIFDCSNGTSTKYYSSLLNAINVVPPAYRTSNRIISYLSTENSTTSAVNYQYHGIDSTTWTDLTKWERIPNQADLVDLRSDLSIVRKIRINNQLYKDIISCILDVKLTLSSDLYASNDLYLNIFGIFSENNRFYIGVYDKTLDCRVGYAATNKVYSTIPSGIEVVSLALTDNDTPYTGQVEVMIDWSRYISSMYYNVNDWGVSIFPHAAQLSSTNSAVIKDLYDKQILQKKACVSGVSSMQMLSGTFAESLISATFFVPEVLIGYDAELGTFGYNNDLNRLYIGLYSRNFLQDSGRMAYFVKEYSSRPTTGIEHMYISGSDGAYTNCAIEVTIDWSKMVDYIDTGLGLTPDVYISSKLLTSNEKLIAESYRDILDIVGTATFTDFADCIEAGQYKLNGNMILSRSVTIPSHAHVYGNQCSVTITNSSAKIITSDDTSINNIKFKGDWISSRGLNTSPGYYTYLPLISEDDIVNATSYSLRRIFIELRGENANINRCIFESITGTAIYANNSADRLLTDNVVVSNCYFKFCECGIYNAGEFNRYAGNIYHGCIYSFISVGGNYSLTSNMIKMCDIGILSDDNGNGGHSQIIGTEAAHCGVAGLYVKSLPRVLGLMLSCCQFSDAPIIGLECNSLVVSNSRLDTWVRIYNGLSNAFIGNIIRNSAALRDSKDIFNVPAGTSLKNNIAMVDGIDSLINN